MMYILSAFFWVSASILAHIIVNKLRLIIRISKVMTLGVFVVGLVGSLATNMWLTHSMTAVSLPYTSIALYIACSLAYMSIAGAPILGDMSPTTKILLSLAKYGPQTEAQIVSWFTYDEAIGKRVQNLIDSKCIHIRKNKVFVTKRGKLLASFFIGYRRLLGLTEGG